MSKKYILLDHTADLRLRIFGETMATLFENAGTALAELICDPETLDAVQTVTIAVTGDDPPDLMVNYLRELLYLWSGEERLIKQTRVGDITDRSISAEVALAPFTPARHTILNEIKAVTYHQIAVEPADDGGWQATVVFDI